MIKLSPAERITLGIVGLTLGLIMAADFLGIIGNSQKQALQQRERFAEMVTLQLSIAIEKNNNVAMRSLLWTLVHRNDQVIGAVVRRRDGLVLGSYGTHSREWHPHASNTETDMTLPIVDGIKHLGSVELTFKPLPVGGPFGLPVSGMVGLSIFVLIFGTLGYWLFLRRSLLYLDPSSVVPARVRKALNVLSNGVLILDEKGQIVLVNDSFSRKMGLTSDDLIGKHPSDFPWVLPEKYGDNFVFPWAETLAKGAEKNRVSLSLKDKHHRKYVFLVSSSPIIDADGKQRGVIVGLDDVTDLKNKNRLLKMMVQELKVSKHQVEEQNEKLHILATRDPLTNCHNRRSMYATVEPIFATAREKVLKLTCIMSDIDHFKAVNDTYGHAAGDEIIKMVASVLIEEAGEDNLVCRYGGEEFCIILMDTGIFDAKKLAERCRQKIAEKITSGVSVTSSFGISTLSYGAKSVDELIQQADTALYESKHKGRNCISAWDKNNDQVESDNVRTVERNVEGQNDKLHILATRDSLTSCYNRRSMYTTVEPIFATAREKDQKLTCIMADIDHLKAVNDTYGHDTGDEIIKMVASVLIEEAGEDNLVCRYSGEEFSIMLMNTRIFDAKKLAERCRQKIAEKITSGASVTASFGVSTLSYGAESIEELIQQADTALYESKHKGRNCISAWDKNKVRKGSDSVRAVEHSKH